MVGVHWVTVVIVALCDGIGRQKRPGAAVSFITSVPEKRLATGLEIGGGGKCAPREWFALIYSCIYSWMYLCVCDLRSQL